MESEKIGRFGVNLHNEQPMEIYTKPKLLIHGTVEEITRCAFGQPFDGLVGGPGPGSGKLVGGTCIIDL